MGNRKNVLTSAYTYQLPKVIYIPSIASHGVGVVLRSDNPKFKPGDHVYGIFRTCLALVLDNNRISIVKPPFFNSWIAHANYFVQPNLDHFVILKNEEGLPWRVYVGVCGMPGTHSNPTHSCTRVVLVTITKNCVFFKTLGKTAYMGWKAFSEAKKVKSAFSPT